MADKKKTEDQKWLDDLDEAIDEDYAEEVEEVPSEKPVVKKNEGKVWTRVGDGPLVRVE